MQEKLQLEERNEQLQAEKERLQYDMLSQQHLGRVLGWHPLDEEGRSAIRRGLRGLGPPSEAGGPAPSDSLPPSLPPGPPSSSATESASDCCKSETESTSDSFKSEGTSRLPSSPPLRRQRVTVHAAKKRDRAHFSEKSEDVERKPTET